MKKIFCVFSVILIVSVLSSVLAFADAAVYDLETTDYYVYVATPDGGLNMRYGPGTEYDKVMEQRIPDGTKLYIGMVSGNWGYTSYNGYEGWVALKQTTTVAPSVESSVPPVPTVVDYYVCVATPDGGLNIRSGPGTEHDTVMEGRIPDGTMLHIVLVSGNWGYTSYNGYDGWVALKQTVTADPESSQTPAAEEKIPEPAEETDEPPVEDFKKYKGNFENEDADLPEYDEANDDLRDYGEDTSRDVETVKKTKVFQIVLIALIVLLVVFAAAIIVVLINKSSRR